MITYECSETASTFTGVGENLGTKGADLQQLGRIDLPEERQLSNEDV